MQCLRSRCPRTRLKGSVYGHNDSVVGAEAFGAKGLNLNLLGVGMGTLREQ